MASLVYFIRRAEGGGPVKIGCSGEPERRLSALSAWAPYPLAVVATMPGDTVLERRFHNLFAAQHSHREWFHPSAELDATIAAVAAGSFDVALLPEPRTLHAVKRGPRSKASRERFYAERDIMRLSLAGTPVPAAIRRVNWYKQTPEQAAALVAAMQAFLAQHEQALSRLPTLAKMRAELAARRAAA